MPVEEQITATPAALDQLTRLRERHGPLLLFLSGGCCEGSSPLCLHEDELPIGPTDLCLGEVGGVPCYIDSEQYHRWNEPAFQLDVAPGESDTFSLENADRLHFIARSSVCSAPSPSRCFRRSPFAVRWVRSGAGQLPTQIPASHAECGDCR